MRLQRTGNYTRAIVLPLIGSLIIIIEVVAIAHMLVQGSIIHLPPLQRALCGISASCWVVNLVLALALVFAPIRLLRRERKLRAAARDDDRRTPLAPLQPDPNAALAAGKTITLTRVARRNLVGIIFGAIITTVLYTLVSLVGPSQLIPAVTRWLAHALFPANFSPEPTFPTPLDWLTLGYPIIFSLALGIAIGWHGISNRVYTISANDDGVTVRRTWQRARFIPWNDIDVFLKLPRRTGHRFIDTYVLHGAEHSVTFFLTGAYLEHASFLHPHGYVRYTADARTLLATIVARSYTPLRLFNTAARSRPAALFFPAATMSTATPARQPKGKAANT